jgi:hypothetical protein
MTRIKTTDGKAVPKKSWERPILFRPSERDRKMLDWLIEWLDDKPARVIRRAIEKLYELERRKADRKP